MPTKYLFTNFAEATLAAEISASATTIYIDASAASLFPVPGASEAFQATIWDGINTPEIVEVSARSGDTLTVTRGADGSSARAWPAGSLFMLALTRALFESIRASSLITQFSSPSAGQYLEFDGTYWKNSSITIAKVSGLQTELNTLNSAISSHTHTAAQIDNGDPVFDTVYAQDSVALADAYNLNSLTAVGVFKVSNPTNGPSAGNWIIYSGRFNADGGWQIGYETTGVKVNPWKRRRVGGTWTAWVEEVDAAYVAIVGAGGVQAANNTGGANALVVDFTPDVTFADGKIISVKSDSPNTIVAPTLSQDGDTARTIVDQAGLALIQGELRGRHLLMADTALNAWRLLNPNSVMNVVEQVFTASGTYTPTVNMQFCLVILTGGGGGGGGVNSTTSPSSFASMGGGGGATAIKLFSAADIGASKAVTIGAGGVGGTGAANGNAGGNSVFHTLTANGGALGLAANLSIVEGNSSLSDATGGDLNIKGQRGSAGSSNGTGTPFSSGEGGGSFWGSGAPRRVKGQATAGVASLPGRDAEIYGAGGGGALIWRNTNGSSTEKGGDGFSGVAVIIEFCGN